MYRTITLNTAEQKLAHYLAKKRFENNRNRGVENRKIGGQSNEETDLEGIAAEIAFCKMFNLYPDTDTGDERPDFDATLHDGSRVDVKSTKYRSGHLIAIRSKRNHAPDLYAMMVGTFPTYYCAGLMDSSDLLVQERLKDFSHGSTYAATQAELFNPESFNL